METKEKGLLEKIKNIKLKAGLAVIAVMNLPVTQVFAAGDKKKSDSTKPDSTSTNDLSFLTDGTNGNGAFDKATKAVQQTGISGITFVRTACLVGAVIAIIICGFKIAASKGSTKEDGKSGLLWAVIGIAIIVAAVSIAGMAMQFGNALG